MIFTVAGWGFDLNFAYGIVQFSLNGVQLFERHRCEQRFQERLGFGGNQPHIPPSAGYQLQAGFQCLVITGMHQAEQLLQRSVFPA